MLIFDIGNSLVYLDGCVQKVSFQNVPSDIEKVRWDGAKDCGVISFIGGVTEQITQLPQYLSIPLEIYRSNQINLINAACNRALHHITANYPELEVSTWDAQLADAKAYRADANALTPILDAIAQSSGQTVVQLADGVLQKSAAYQAISGSLVGRRLLLTAQIKSASTVEAIQSIVWDAS